jgi:hypothetical protein
MQQTSRIAWHRLFVASQTGRFLSLRTGFLGANGGFKASASGQAWQNRPFRARKRAANCRPKPRSLVTYFTDLALNFTATLHLLVTPGLRLLASPCASAHLLAVSRALKTGISVKKKWKARKTDLDSTLKCNGAMENKVSWVILAAETIPVVRCQYSPS